METPSTILSDIESIESIIITLKMIMKKYILQNLRSIELQKIWHRLPTHLQEEMEPKLPCYKHHQQTQWDGPPIPKYLCPKCNNY